MRKIEFLSSIISGIQSQDKRQRLFIIIDSKFILLTHTYYLRCTTQDNWIKCGPVIQGADQPMTRVDLETGLWTRSLQPDVFVSRLCVITAGVLLPRELQGQKQKTRLNIQKSRITHQRLRLAGKSIIKSGKRKHPK